MVQYEIEQRLECISCVAREAARWTTKPEVATLANQQEGVFVKPERLACLRVAVFVGVLLIFLRVVYILDGTNIFEPGNVRDGIAHQLHAIEHLVRCVVILLTEWQQGFVYRMAV